MELLPRQNDRKRNRLLVLRFTNDLRHNRLTLKNYPQKMKGLKMEQITVNFWTIDKQHGKSWFYEHTKQVDAESMLDDVLWHIENHNKHHGTTWKLYGKPFVVVM